MDALHRTRTFELQSNTELKLWWTVGDLPEDFARRGQDAAAAEAVALAGVVTQVRKLTGATIVMVEHDLPLVWQLADRIVVLEEGAVVASGRPAEVRDHPAVAFGEFG